MRLLLDTHVLLWWLEENPTLSTEARAAIGEASGDLPADMLCIGKHDVQRHGADFASGFKGLLDRLRARQVEEGIEGFIRFELGGL